MNVPSIVVTIGKKGFNDKNMRGLLRYNISYLRFNSGRCPFEWISEAINELKRLGFKDEQFLIDIGNQKPRVQFLKSDIFSFSEDCLYTLSSDDKSDIILNNSSIISSIQHGDVLIFGDGEIEVIVEKKENGILYVRPLCCGEMEGGVAIRKKNDMTSSMFNISVDEIDSVNRILSETHAGLILSFVDNTNNVELAKRLFPNASIIIPKIETKSAVKNLEDICKVSDIVFLGRGDLALSVGWYKIGVIQREIVGTVKSLGCRIIIGTGTLNTLQWNRMPSSAEVIDVTNSVFAGADWIALTSETGGSDRPLQSVEILSTVLSYMESVC